MEAKMESPTFLRRLFGDQIDRGAWRIDVANENDELEGLFDADDMESVVVMVYGKKKRSRR